MAGATRDDSALVTARLSATAIPCSSPSPPAAVAEVDGKLQELGFELPTGRGSQHLLILLDRALALVDDSPARMAGPGSARGRTRKGTAPRLVFATLSSAKRTDALFFLALRNLFDEPRADDTSR